jgi:GAF domain-containing protein
MVAAEKRRPGYEYSSGRTTPLTAESAAGLWGQVESSQSTVRVIDQADPNGGQLNQTLVVPISVRGETIGLLNLEAAGQEKSWTEDDLNLIRAVADQVGMALENARLLEQTQKRAERERLVSEITTKIRASNDPQVILATALRELQQALKANQAHIVVSSSQERVTEAPSSPASVEQAPTPSSSGEKNPDNGSPQE